MGDVIDMSSSYFNVDPAFDRVSMFTSPLVRDVWQDKYRFQEETFGEQCHRVAKAIYEHDPDKVAMIAAKHAMWQQLWIPAGRIWAGAGTGKRVTLMNCFVNAKMEDDMPAITEALGNTMLTQQQGGGIGTDFSPLRPPKAWLFRTGALASGPGPFIDVFDSAGTTIRSAGDRRGAQMGTLICTHPFLPDFIVAKQEKGRWTNFNVSVLITDAFMSAVDEDEDWLLYHSAKPGFDRPQELVERDFEDDHEVIQYVYSIWKARDLWDMILKSTYDYAEPGVIFIDRVNDLNNLNYAEEIMCTNPCGEQPLPPHGCCNLGAVNLSRMVRDPFTEDATFDWELLRQIVRTGIRFLDNVIDVTLYPLPQQEQEEKSKRRIGLGMTGLCDAMHMLCMRYGSNRSIQFAEKVARFIANESYRASADLAKERGVFPLFDADKINRTMIEKLDGDVQDAVREWGLRNGVLNTIAPTGTTSIAFCNNGSSGLEPVFMHATQRNVTQPDGTRKPYVEYGFGAQLFQATYPDASELPKWMNECHDVTIREHVKIQEVCQRWVDASISKTINLPEDIDFESFKDVYQLAYDSGLKGCTTYRPSEVRGAILQAPSEALEVQPTGNGSLPYGPVKRPIEVPARTVKVHWPSLRSALYLTVGYVDGKPFEVFLNSKDQSAMEWMTTTTLLMSMVLRRGVHMDALADEFMQVHSLEGGWADGRYYPSLVAYLGKVMKDLVQEGDTDEEPALEGGSHSSGDQGEVWEFSSTPKSTQCKQCGSYNTEVLGGCPTCKDCGWSKCQ